MGSVFTSLGSYSIRIAPSSTDVNWFGGDNKQLGVDADIIFTPNATYKNKNYAAGTEIKIVQISKLFTRKAFLPNEFSDWHIDDPNALDDPYYALPGAGSAGGGSGEYYYVQGAPQKKMADARGVDYNGVEAKLTDTPGEENSGILQIQDWFEDAAIIANGPAKGTILWKRVVGIFDGRRRCQYWLYLDELPRARSDTR